MPVLAIPRLVGSREAANAMISRLGNITGQVLVLDCTELVSGSISFANQLIVRLFEDKHPARVEVVGADEEFWGYLRTSAESIGAADKVVKGVSGLLVAQ